jgi:hypothetical protein
MLDSKESMASLIRRVVDAAPPLSADQRAALTALLFPFLVGHTGDFRGVYRRMSAGRVGVLHQVLISGRFAVSCNEGVVRRTQTLGELIAEPR